MSSDTQTTGPGPTTAVTTSLVPVKPKSDKLIVQDDGPVALFDTGKFEHMQRIAALMANASLIPDHLRGTKKKGQPLVPFRPEQVLANCFLVVNQSVRWGLDPFSVAPETYAVGGKLAFQGKLIAALVNSRAGLRGRLRYSFKGTGDKLTVTVR